MQYITATLLLMRKTSCLTKTVKICFWFIMFSIFQITYSQAQTTSGFREKIEKITEEEIISSFLRGNRMLFDKSIGDIVKVADGKTFSEILEENLGFALPTFKDEEIPLDGSILKKCVLGNNILEYVISSETKNTLTFSLIQIRIYNNQVEHFNWSINTDINEIFEEDLTKFCI